MPEYSLSELLALAVAAVRGTARPGQEEMAEAVSRAAASGEHLVVQAGTGTGKSLAYLVPALMHARSSKKPVVVATATLALQAQIVERDLPRLATALAAVIGKASFGVL
ncbi:MAG: DEAD/DEAH box helicase, partial [Angustibacter sp.]